MAMQRIEIIEQLKEICEIITEKSYDIDLKDADKYSLVDDLGLASVSMLYLVILIEEKFGVSFDDVNFGDFKTVGNVVDYIEKGIK